MLFNELKNYPVDKRTTIPVLLRIVLSTVAAAVIALLCHKLLPVVADKVDLKLSVKELRLTMYITVALMYIRYLVATLNRKWGYAFLMFAYDVMKRPDALVCPRCKTRLEKDLSDIDYNAIEIKQEVRECHCPNTNCALSLQDKMTFSQCPPSRSGLKAFVLNMGVKDDYIDKPLTKILKLLLALVISAGFALAITLVALPFVAKIF